MTKSALILMTALIPTTGHASLIEFAANLPDVSMVVVMVNSRSFEPYSGASRSDDLDRNFFSSDTPVYVYNCEDDTVPQNPEDHPHFWQWWAGYIRTKFPYLPPDQTVLVAAEEYGVKVAEALGCDFMPYDVDRDILPITGTEVRSDMLANWDYILPATQKNFQTRVTLFGQESVGKTSIARALNKQPDWTALPEYARGYLETVGSDLNQKKMDDIFMGQYALQVADRSTPFIVQDTDLFSTIGYAELKGYEVTERMVSDALELQSDVYYVLSDADVPFVPNRLRYGGHKRESSREFWINILEKYELNYEFAGVGSVMDKSWGVFHSASRHALKKFRPIQEFKRD